MIILYDGQILTNSYAFIYIEIQIRWSSLEYYSLNWWKTLVINFLINKKKKKKLNDKLIWIEYIINNGLILTNSCAFIYINIQIRWSSLEYYSLN